jgi:hypothetical protein
MALLRAISGSRGRWRNNRAQNSQDAGFKSLGLAQRLSTPQPSTTSSTSNATSHQPKHGGFRAAAMNTRRRRGCLKYVKRRLFTFFVRQRDNAMASAA